MKRLHIRFLPAELETPLINSIDLENMTVDYCISSFPGDMSEDSHWLEELRVAGEHIHVAGAHISQEKIDEVCHSLLTLIKTEIDPMDYFDGETVLVGGGKYKAYLVFGEVPASFDVFSYDTQRELDIFLEGVDAMNQWQGYRHANDVDEEELKVLERENPDDYARLLKHLSGEV